MRPHSFTPHLLTTLLQLRSNHSSDKGVTLIEVLVGMLIITVVVSVITPPIFLAAATRVNQRRTEQAMQLAQKEIEQARIKVYDSPVGGALPETLPASVAVSFDTVSAPTGTCATLNVGRFCSSGTEVRLIDDNGDGRNDFMIQTFRDAGLKDPSNPGIYGFKVGVRVYSAEAEGRWSQLSTQRISLPATTGLGSRLNYPIVTFFTEIAKGDSRETLNLYRSYLPSTSP